LFKISEAPQRRPSKRSSPDQASFEQAGLPTAVSCKILCTNHKERPVMRSWNALLVVVVTASVVSGSAQREADPARRAPGHLCTAITQANADASAGTVNIQHDGTPIAGIPAPDISRGFSGIPRSAQPPLTASQQRILECTYRVPEANADIPYTLFVPSTYDPQKPTPLVVDLHGLNITPLQQILFDGTTDFAERYGFIVLAPMGFNVSSWWGSRTGTPVATAAVKPGGDVHYTSTELAEIDTMALLKSIREQYNVDSDRIYLMGHSMGGAGTYYLGGKYNDIWAGLAPLSGAGGIAEGAAERYKALPMLIMHGAKDSIVPAATSRRAVAALQAVGAPHIYLEFPDKDHEFWIRRGAAQMEKVFLFFNLVSKRTTILLPQK
jgi:predicted esterase